MKIILNYKSYYEAFKLGVTDNGVTDVARLLFYPISCLCMELEREKHRFKRALKPLKII